jgi:hypothetical protein
MVETHVAEEEIVTRFRSLFVRLLKSEGKHNETRIGNEAIKALVYFYRYRQWDVQGKEKTSKVASTICVHDVNKGSKQRRIAYLTGSVLCPHQSVFATLH